MSTYYTSNPRPGLPGIIITLCWVTLCSLVIWYALSNFRQLQTSPEMRAAEAALKRKDSTQARKEFDTALKGHSDDVGTYLEIAKVCHKQKQWDLGIEYLRHAVQACKDQPKPGRALLHNLLATFLIEAHPQPPQTEAIESAERALELSPDDPEMLNLVGYLLADNNVELDRAQDYIARALRLASDQKDDSPELTSGIEDSYGWVLYRQGKYAAAVEALTQAIADIPDNTLTPDDLKVYYYHLGAADHKAGYAEAAQRALRTALQYDSDYMPAKTELAALLPAAR